MVDGEEIDRLFGWMAAGAQPPKPMAGNVAHLLEGLRRAGVPVTRFALFVRTIHPQVKGRRVLWTPEDGVAVDEASHDFFTGPAYLESPAGHVFTAKTPIRRCFARGDAPGFRDLEEMRDRGTTDYYAQPLLYTDGSADAATWATDRPGGFTDAMIAAFDRLNPAIARLIEIWILKRNTIAMMSTYVGRGAGAQVLSGHIQPGDVETISCVILFADLVGFTAMSNSRPVGEVLETLNHYFGVMETEIGARGGEILKLIGDGVLAIFPVDADAHAVAAQALAAADAARAALADEAPFRAALHVGDVAYGNIGGATRLDFTAIGPDVNLTARLLSTAEAHGAALVCSAAFAALSDGRAQPAGDTELKGFAAPQPVFRL